MKKSSSWCNGFSATTNRSGHEVRYANHYAIHGVNDDVGGDDIVQNDGGNDDANHRRLTVFRLFLFPDEI